MHCILCWLKGEQTFGKDKGLRTDAKFIINGMSVCDGEVHLEAAVKTLTPEEAIEYIGNLP